MKEDQDKTEIKEGVPWKNTGRFETWKKADKKRQALMKEWKEKKSNHMQVKVKKLSSCFVVKTRANPDIKKATDSKKNKRKNHTQKK